jgi:pilus assembly protein FimV
VENAMNLPNFALCLLAALASTEALAFQIGQLTPHSYLGEHLDARVSLFGVVPAEAAAITIEVKPAIGLPPSSAARRAVEDFTATVALDEAGQPYLALRSTTPVSETTVDFRLRVANGREATIAHFRLHLVPRARPAAATPTNRTAQHLPATTLLARPLPGGSGHYGPVRPGRSLWRILGELGLGTRDRDAIIARIVAANPQAFVAGDPDRLRVGAMLDLATVVSQITGRLRPADAGESRVSSAAVVSSARETDSLHAARLAAEASSHAALTARLETLSTKFADIKARYAEQESSAAATTTSPLLATRTSPNTMRPVEATAPAPAIAPPRMTPASVAAEKANASRASKLSGPFVLGIGALISALALVGGLVLSIRGNRRRPTHGRSVSTDQQKLAEITRKTEKRVLLEDTVKRSLGERRSRMPAGAIDARATELRAVDHRIAHGQYAEAETLLRRMIANAPQDFQAKLRLAETHYLDENTEAFVALADELYRLHRSEIGDGAWQRIMRMGRMLAPDRPPFSGPVPIPRQA